MKMMTRFVMLLAIVTICLPAQADILVYAKTIKLWEAWESEPYVFNINDWTIKGYLVLDVSFNEDGTLEGIQSAEQIEYWKEGRDKWYTVNKENFNLRTIDYGNIGWVLYQVINNSENEADTTMLRGTAKYTDIGLGRDTRREIAQTLSGLGLFNERDVDFGWCEWTLRLQQNWTKWSNQDEDDIEATVDNITGYLEDRGYIED